MYTLKIIQINCFCGVFALQTVGGTVCLEISCVVGAEEEERALKVVCPFRLSVLLCASWRSGHAAPAIYEVSL